MVDFQRSCPLSLKRGFIYNATLSVLKTYIASWRPVKIVIKNETEVACVNGQRLSKKPQACLMKLLVAGVDCLPMGYSPGRPEAS